MARIDLKETHKVIIIESERGWGQKVDETLYFDNADEAKAFVRKYNENLPDGPAPDWYMMASYEGLVR